MNTKTSQKMSSQNANYMVKVVQKYVFIKITRSTNLIFKK